MRILLFLTIISFSYDLFAQSTPQTGGFDFKQKHPCLTPDQRLNIQKMLDRNVRNLESQGILSPYKSGNNIASFGWPLVLAQELEGFNNYFSISAFFDHNVGTGNGIKDHSCGTRTYDGHKGTDIQSWPFPWYLYENNLVQVVAVETGTIIGKSNGNFDQNCTHQTGALWNAVYIRHADNSVVWYGHLKDNSLTTKEIGATVNKGEYLGVMASSGYSNGPHLHLEVYNSDGQVIDPFAGNCNNINTSSWWDNQEPPNVPTLNALLTHSTPPQIGCPTPNEHPNLSNYFTAGETVYIGAFFRDQTMGYNTNYTLKKPDGNVFSSWTSTPSTNYNTSWWWFSRNLPDFFGTWTIEAVHNGQTIAHQFEYQLTPLPVDLLYFKGKSLDNHVLLDWKTVSEINNLGFEIQRSGDGSNWQKIAFIDGAGNTTNQTTYEYVDHQPLSGTSYYRLKQIDFDNQTEFSNMVSINRPQGEIIISPNPTNDRIYITGGNNLIDPKVQVYDPLGRKLLDFSDTNTIDLSHLSNGVYLVTVQTKKGSTIHWVVKN